MKSIKRNKILFWMFIILMLINSITLVIFWAGKINKAPIPKSIMAKELQLDKQQQKQLYVLIDEHRKESMILRNKIRVAKKEMFDLAKNPVVNENEKRLAVGKTGKSIADLDMLTLNHFQKIRSICNEPQKKLFDELLKKMAMTIGAGE
jgi:Spy/CpxP family protein refolding chaperone